MSLRIRTRTRVRLNTEDPDLMTSSQIVQGREKVETHDSFPSAEEQILRMQQTLGNDSVQRLIASGEIRTRLQIGRPNDRYEREADRAADRVTAVGMFAFQSQPTDSGDRREAFWSTEPLVQTQSEPAGKIEKEEEGVGEVETAPDGLENQLKAGKTGGAPLLVETQSMMESRFGANFSDVRVHDDAEAHRMNRSLQARAFTHENHIYFGAGYYNPQTPDGQHLLAHELAHVLQQGEEGRNKEPQNQSGSQSETGKETVRRSSWGSLGGLLGNLGSIVRGGFSAAKRFFRDKLSNIPGYSLLGVVLGRDPFTGEEVPRTATNFVRGFLSLLADGEERYRNLKKSGALDRAFQWLGKEVKKLELTWDGMVALFTRAWESFSLADLAKPVEAFKRIVKLFAGPVGRIIRFAAAVGLKILEFVFEGVMGETGARVLEILKRGKNTFLTIIKDPVAFLGHLIDAVKLGFQQFSDNIWTHLQAGLVGWLFGALEGAGLQLPEKFDLRGILSLVLQILGLTYDRIRPKLVKLLGEDVVVNLESAFDFLRQLVTEGPAAAWEKIVEFAGNLRDMVFDGIKNFVVTRIVTAAVIQIAAMFNPAGAIIQSILAIYNTVMFFIERINQILAVVESLIASVANIAAGKIAAAANYVEQTMARTIPVVISFLARLMKLGNISAHIKKIIERIRQPIDSAIDKVVEWIASQANRFKEKISGGKDKTAEEPKPEPVAEPEPEAETKAEADTDTENSRAVKEKVKKELQGKDLTNFNTNADIIHRTFVKFKPEGLKTLRLEIDKNNPNEFDVKASASLEQTVNSFSTRKLPDKMKTICLDMNPFSTKTSLYVFYDGRKPYGYRGRSSAITEGRPFTNTSGTSFKRHAEENFLRQSQLDGSHSTPLPSIVDYVRQRRTHHGEDNVERIIPLTLDINRTPCGPLVHDCAAKLSTAAGNYSGHVRMTVNSVSAYATGLSGNTFALTTTKDINDMIAAGIEVKPLRIWDRLMLILKNAGKAKEVEINGRLYSPNQDWAGFSSEEAGMAGLIEEAAAEAEKERKALEASEQNK